MEVVPVATRSFPAVHIRAVGTSSHQAISPLRIPKPVISPRRPPPAPPVPTGASPPSSPRSPPAAQPAPTPAFVPPFPAFSEGSNAGEGFAASLGLLAPATPDADGAGADGVVAQLTSEARARFDLLSTAAGADPSYSAAATEPLCAAQHSQASHWGVVNEV